MLKQEPSIDEVKLLVLQRRRINITLQEMNRLKAGRHCLLTSNIKQLSIKVHRSDLRSRMSFCDQTTNHTWATGNIKHFLTIAQPYLLQHLQLKMSGSTCLQLKPFELSTFRSKCCEVVRACSTFGINHDNHR